MSQELIVEHLHLIFIFGLLSVFTHWLAKSRGLFTLPQDKRVEKTSVSGMQVLIAFIIYLASSLFLAPLVSRIIHKNSALSPIALLGVLQLSSLLLILSLFFLFSLQQGKSFLKRIWLRAEKSLSSVFYDFLLGALFWFIAFPLVAAIGQISDLLIYVFFGVENYEQIAVRFLKLVLGFRSILIVVLITILALAPVIEEWLFRGFLQNFFRARFGTKAAILLTSLCFAIFHLSSSQGWGNISLALSLFSFSCYLGFLYERQGSLLAPIGLHMAFNTVSSIRILLLPPT